MIPREGKRALLTQKGNRILYLLWIGCPVHLETLIVRVLSPRKVSELSVCLPCALSSAPPFSGCFSVKPYFGAFWSLRVGNLPELCEPL